MKKRILHVLTSWWPIGLFVGVELLILISNYVPGTYLLGWDNLVPELNIKLHLMRSIFGVWQENRGVCLYDGMSHIANLLHTISIFLLSLALPQNMLRYTFTILMHLAGGIGVLVLVKTLLQKEKPVAASLAATTGG